MREMPTTRVLLIDADETARAQIRRLLSPLGRRRFPIDEARSIADAEPLLARHSPDVVILGVGARAPEAATELQTIGRRAPDAAIVLLTPAPLTNADGELLAATLAGADEWEAREDLDAPALLRALRHALDRKRRERTLVKLAAQDPLTGLPNRLGFTQTLQRAVERSRHNGLPFTVMFLDLDRFKAVNDELGHAAGDALLRQVAGRLQRSVREGDTVARLGGDEFVVLAESLLSDDDAAIVADRMCTTLAAPFVLGEREVSVSASIGVALYPAEARDADELLRRADEAMYRSKRSGGNGFEFVSREREGRLPSRLALEARLRRALSQGEFTLHYQPKVELATGEVRGVEALLRWQGDAENLTPPSAFVPLLEETGLILAVGEWVLRTACAGVARLRAEGFDLDLAVNVSARQLGSPDLAKQVARILEETGLPPSSLELELTEGMLIEDGELQRAHLATLRSLGVTISLDDFGTGYSSLSYLRHLPIDRLKIDRAFVADVARDPKARAIGKSIIALAHCLELTVVAEGVETAEQLAFLAANGCDAVQGFHIAMPQPIEALGLWLARRLRLVA